MYTAKAVVRYMYYFKKKYRVYMYTAMHAYLGTAKSCKRLKQLIKASESNTGQVSHSFTAAVAALSEANEAMPEKSTTSVSNVDQFPLPFVLDLQAHGHQGVQVVRHEALMKRQATMQILCGGIWNVRDESDEGNICPLSCHFCECRR